MTLRNTYNSYGSLTKFFHWLIAPLVIIMLLLGVSFSYIHSLQALSILVPLHKSLGLTVGVLMILRLLWRWTNARPYLPDPMPKWQKKAARWSHGLMYLTIIVMPLVGLAMSTAMGYTTTVWWWFTVKMPWIPMNKTLASYLSDTHTLLAWIIFGLITIHILAAWKHHLINKDHVLKRMLPQREHKYFRQ